MVFQTTSLILLEKKTYSSFSIQIDQLLVDLTLDEELEYGKH
jgi:hypothetical protein